MAKVRPTNSAPTADQHLALTYFRFGQELARRGGLSARQFANLAGEYGLPATPHVQYKSMRLARLFRHNELVRLCRPRAGGRSLGWSVVIELLQVPDARNRERYAALAVRNRLNSAGLREQIRRDAGRGSLRPGSGRKRREPESLAEAIRLARGDLEALKFNLAVAISLSRGITNRRLSQAKKVLEQIGKPLSPSE